MTSSYLHHCTLWLTFILALGTDATKDFSSVDTQSNSCLGRSSHVYFSDASDCSIYYFCDNNKEYATKCPIGFYFNKETFHCDFSENVNCNLVVDSPDLESIVSPAPDFDCPGDGKWAHETACEKYYECRGGEATLEICRDNLLFDLRYNECNFPEGVDCGDRVRPTDVPGTQTPPISTTTPTTTTESHETPETEDPITNPVTTSTENPPSTSVTIPTTTAEYNFVCPRPEGNFADPEDCTAFYNCVDNEVIGHQFCPEGLLFNPNIENCDYPWNVDCNT